MVLLQEFPIELLVFIFSFFSIRERRIVAQVCKQFKQLASPAGVRVFRLTAENCIISTSAKNLVGLCNNLRAVHLLECEPRARCWNTVNVINYAMTHCPRLVSISLTVDFIMLPRFLKKLKNTPNIKTLALGGHYDCNSFIEHASAMSNISDLHLVKQSGGNHFLTDAFLFAIAPHLVRLETLKVDDIISDSGFNEVLQTTCSKLKILDIRDARLVTAGTFDHLTPCTSLHTLSIGQCVLDAVIFKKMLSLQQLRHLAICNAVGLGGACFTWGLSGSSVQQLETIVLSNCDNFDSISVYRLALNAPKLKYFVLWGGPAGQPQVSNASMNAIIRYCKLLRYIHLKNVLHVDRSFVDNVTQPYLKIIIEN